MRNTVRRLCLSVAAAIAASFFTFPSSASADGGPILTDPQLWASLKEGQQTAVITLKGDNTAHVDLFVLMLDNTGQGHEVVYFVPLGIGPKDFSVNEKMSLDFDQVLTKKLDETIRDRAQDKNNLRLYLIAPSSVISGGWMFPLYVPFFLTGCATPATPEATFQTESSSVSIYGLNEDTDLQTLIETTGLDPLVKETLSRLKGQRIAVINLQTRPAFPGRDSSSSYFPTGQPGIHMSWTTTLIPKSTKVIYSYPLGTGSAWSSPIQLTRVYVVASPGVDSSVQYPKLGVDRSGYNFEFIFGQDTPRIAGYYDSPAYAVDEASGSFGRIWRATYVQSNASQDIIVQTGSKGALVRARQYFSGLGGSNNLLIGILAALALWVVAWRYIMPRMLGIKYGWRKSGVWCDSLVCLGINTGIVVISAVVKLSLSV